MDTSRSMLTQKALVTKPNQKSWTWERGRSGWEVSVGKGRKEIREYGGEESKCNIYLYETGQPQIPF